MKTREPVTDNGNIELLPGEGIKIPLSRQNGVGVVVDIAAADLKLRIGATIDGEEVEIVAPRALSADPDNATGRLIIITDDDADDIVAQAGGVASWYIIDGDQTPDVVISTGRITVQRFGP